MDPSHWRSGNPSQEGLSSFGGLFSEGKLRAVDVEKREGYGSWKE